MDGGVGFCGGGLSGVASTTSPAWKLASLIFIKASLNASPGSSSRPPGEPPARGAYLTPVRTSRLGCRARCRKDGARPRWRQRASSWTCSASGRSTIMHILMPLSDDGFVGARLPIQPRRRRRPSAAVQRLEWSRAVVRTTEGVHGDCATVPIGSNRAAVRPCDCLAAQRAPQAADPRSPPRPAPPPGPVPHPCHRTDPPEPHRHPGSGWRWSSAAGV